MASAAPSYAAASTRASQREGVTTHCWYARLPASNCATIAAFAAAPTRVAAAVELTSTGISEEATPGTDPRVGDIDAPGRDTWVLAPVHAAPITGSSTQTTARTDTRARCNASLAPAAAMSAPVHPRGASVAAPSRPLVTLVRRIAPSTP